MSSKVIKAILKEKGGIQLDIGCGHNKQAGFVGMDIQPLDNVDIVHDFLVFPWPLPDNSVVRAMASHIVEHIPPVMVTREDGTWFPFLEFMDEVWRVMQPDGQFAISMPYATSAGMYQDPTHCNFCNENTWLYFDPINSRDGGVLYKFYRPKPWQLEGISFDPAGSMEVLMRKRRVDRSYEG